MKLRKVRGGTREAVLVKRYSIAVGCSLGNKWFTPDNVRQCVEWALEHTKDRVCVYVADSIHGINISVRKKIPLNKAIAIGKEKGKEFLEEMKNACSDLEKFDRVDFCGWEEINTPEYKKKVKYLYELYNNNQEFRNVITTFVREFVSKETRKFTEEEIEILGTYLLEELPECMNVVPMSGTMYEAWMYPYDGPTVAFTEDLQEGRVFPEVAKSIVEEKKAFLEFR